MRILISLPAQTLDLFDETGRLLARYPVSTAKSGAGERSGSQQTPRGRHLIRAKIGAGQPENAVFVGRRPTGDIWSPEFAAAHPGRDWILTRILWLSGREPGFNRLGRVDTMRRYIYIHGCADTAPMGVPASIGCVRMRNRDVVELFEQVPCYTPVRLVEYSIDIGDWGRLGQEAATLREAVFVAEQGVPPEMELDELDATAIHAVARDPAGLAIGTARLIREAAGRGKIGRMAVAADWRGLGVGEGLLLRLMERAADDGLAHLHLSAQTHAADFYRRYGFVAAGGEYLDAGLPHVTMVRESPGPAAS